MERSLNFLYPTLAGLAKTFIWRCENLGIDIEIFETWRSIERQKELSKDVTRADSWKSWHQYGLAFDAVFRDPNTGSWYWESDKWEIVGGVGIDLGLIWGGNFKSIIDRPHFEYTLGLSIQDAYSIAIKNGGGVLAVWKEIISREK